MKDGAVLANAGHFDVEIDLPELRELAGRARPPGAAARRAVRPGDRRLNLLARAAWSTWPPARATPPR